MKKCIQFLIISFVAAIQNISCSSDTELDLYCTLTGQVTDAQIGEPIKAAEILLTPGGMTTVSGSDGSFEFVKLDAGQYTIFVQADGYVSNRKIVNAIAGEVRHVDVPLSKQ